MTDDLTADAAITLGRDAAAQIPPAFEAAAGAVVRRIGPAHLRVLATRIADGWPEHSLRSAVPAPGFAEAAAALRSAQQAHGVPDVEAAAYLHGLAAGHTQRSAAMRVESVWSGPSSHAVPVRAMARVLVELVDAATRELMLMTYSARPYRPLLTALSNAVTRGVTADVVVETLAGAGSALTGAEPAAAFAEVTGLRLWHWPAEQRSRNNAKMHAKLAVADRVVMLVSSANLTQSGVDRNIEAGLLVYGGEAPQRAAEHIVELIAKGVLAPLRSGGQ